MKKVVGFWGSFENYVWKVVMRASPTLPYFAAGLMLLVIGASTVSGKSSLAGARDLREASVKAARVGDYAKAQALWNNQAVLGNEGEEELVFPQRVVEREIAKYEEMLKRYPGHRDIYLAIAKLYDQIGESQLAKKYVELARELDPNNPMIKSQVRNQKF